MYKKILLGMVALSFLTILFAACAIRDEAANVGVEVQMGAASFAVTEITIKKGEKLTFVDAAGVAHILENGAWDGTTAKPGAEGGAPTINMNIASGRATSPAFNTAGTFNIYCTIHPGMQIKVIVTE